MIELDIPGRGNHNIEHVVFDVNGTLAVDGIILPGVEDLLKTLKDQVKIHLLTADTHGRQQKIDRQLGLSAVRVNRGNETQQKADYLIDLGKEKSAAIGQGASDSLMLKEAVIGICLLSQEGTSLDTILAADIIVPDVIAAINLLLNPIRLIASLRK